MPWLLSKAIAKICVSLGPPWLSWKTWSNESVWISHTLKIWEKIRIHLYWHTKMTCNTETARWEVQASYTLFYHIFGKLVLHQMLVHLIPNGTPQGHPKEASVGENKFGSSWCPNSLEPELASLTKRPGLRPTGRGSQGALLRVLPIGVSFTSSS